MTDPFREGYVVQPGEGKYVTWGPNRARFKVRGEDTQGRLSIVEFELGVGIGGPPLHTDNHDELFYVLDGEVTFQVEDAIIEAATGALVFAPEGVLHAFENRGSSTAQLLIMFSPGGFERYFEELSLLADAGPLDMSKVAPIAARHGTNYVGMPLWRDT